MRTIRTLAATAATVGGMSLATAARADVFITEFQYNGIEFFELTNLGPAPVDFTGWSYSDDDQAPGTVDLSAFGVVGVNESVILTEETAFDFRTAFGLSASVKVIGENADNLGRNDGIYIYDGASALVDSLDFGDQDIPGSIRTDVASGNPTSLAVLGTNNVLNWVLSFDGDTYGSFLAGAPLAALPANPGIFTLIPEPASAALLALGGLLIARRRRA